MTGDFYSQIRRDAFQAGITIVCAVWLFSTSAGLFRSDHTGWGWSALIFGLICAFVSLRSYPRFKVFVLKPDETMVDFLERMKREHPGHVQVKKGDDDADA